MVITYHHSSSIISISCIPLADINFYRSNSFSSILNPSGPTILWSHHLFSPSWTPLHLCPTHFLPSLLRFNSVISHYHSLQTPNSLPPCSFCPTYLVRQYPRLNKTLWLLPICTKQLSMTGNKYTTVPLFLCKFNAKNSSVHVTLLQLYCISLVSFSLTRPFTFSSVPKHPKPSLLSSFSIEDITL